MRVVVTGAAGFFGSRLLAQLQRHDVHALDVGTANRQRIEALAPHARFHACDVFDAATVDGVLREIRPEIAVHLAWYAVPGKYLSAPENLDHLKGAIDFARAAVGAGATRIVTAGTCFEYDTSFGLLREATPALPRSLYAATKLSMYETLRAASRQWNVAYAHLRFFYQYGPWEAPGRLVPAVVEPLLRGEEARVTSGEQVRDFLHVDDLARASALVAESSEEGVINVASGVPIRVRDVVHAAARACGREDLVRYGALPPRENDPPFICADVARLRKLGFQPRFDLESGLRDTVSWYRARQSS